MTDLSGQKFVLTFNLCEAGSGYDPTTKILTVYAHGNKYVIPLDNIGLGVGCIGKLCNP